MLQCKLLIKVLCSINKEKYFTGVNKLCKSKAESNEMVYVYLQDSIFPKNF